MDIDWSIFQGFDVLYARVCVCVESTLHFLLFAVIRIRLPISPFFLISGTPKYTHNNGLMREKGEKTQKKWKAFRHYFLFECVCVCVFAVLTENVLFKWFSASPTSTSLPSPPPSSSSTMATSTLLHFLLISKLCVSHCLHLALLLALTIFSISLHLPRMAIVVAQSVEHPMANSWIDRSKKVALKKQKSLKCLCTLIQSIACI